VLRPELTYSINLSAGASLSHEVHIGAVFLAIYGINTGWSESYSSTSTCYETYSIATQVLVRHYFVAIQSERIYEELDFYYELMQLIAREECSSPLGPSPSRLMTLVL